MAISQTKKPVLQRIIVMALLVSGILTMAAAYGAEPSEKDGTFKADTRGFGNVEVTLRHLGEKKDASWTTFAAQDAEHAKITGSKRLADLLGFGDIKQASGPGLNGAAPEPSSFLGGLFGMATNDGLPGTVLELKDAGWWLLGLDGQRFHELFAPTAAELRDLAKSAGANGWSAVPAHAYPRWLDCFDNAAMCFWFSGMGVLPKDSIGDFRWLSENGFTAVTALGATEERLVAPGLIDTAALDWQRELARQFNVPFKTMARMEKPIRPSWLWNTTPLPYQTTTFMPVAQTDRYLMDYRRRFAEHLTADPNFIGHMVLQEGPGHDPTGLLTLAEVAHEPAIQALWREYLRDARKLGLADVARRHRGDAGAFRNWNQVPIPELKELAGWDPVTSIDLLGTWLGRADRGGKALEEKWFAPETPADGWVPVDCRDPAISLYCGKGTPGDYWLRKSFTVTPAQAAAKYLHLPRLFSHNGGARFPEDGCEVWLNGTKLAMIGSANPSCLGWDLCYDAGPALKPGENLIAINTKGFALPADYGYAFLGRLGPWLYPGGSETLNAKAFDLLGFQEWLVMRELEQRMIAIRAGDPYRPMKIMAPHNYMDSALDLCARYGAYPHDTGGAAAWFGPFTYSRYAITRGLPNSVEPGNAPGSAADIRAGITRYLMMGTEMVDWVASVETYRNPPEVGPWIAENRELLRCFGKIDLAPPQIGILRVGRELRMGITDIYSWDMGRGAMSAIGRPFLYATLGDVHSGRANRFPVLLDCGTTVLAEDEVAAIEAYVRQGGTFVAFHNTGMHTPEKRGAWPISKLTGLRVVNGGRAIGGAKIRFKDDQELWPKLRGAELPGWGLVLDWQKNDLTGAPLALSAAADAEIAVVAEWQGLNDIEGNIAVAVRRLGKGKVVTLGSTFYRKGRDEGGRYVEEGTLPYLDELLTSLGAPRESQGNGLWAEPWRSKNGVYDTWLVTQMDPKAAPGAFEVRLRREAAAPGLRDLSALGHPAVNATHADGWLTIPGVEMQAMQARVLAAPRADLANGARDWFDVLARRWHPVEKPGRREVREATVEQPENLLPLVEDWQCATGEAEPAAWTTPGSEPAGEWKTARLGAFATMGLPEDALVRFRKEVKLPESWRQQDVTLAFDAEGWFWGINPAARLWINGEPAAIAQPLKPSPSGGFRVAVPPTQTATGRLVIALEVDGRKPGYPPGARPKGVSGTFFLEARPRPVQSMALGDWRAAADLNVLAPVADGKTPEKTLYLETRFTLAAQWPAERLWLVAPGAKLGKLFINNYPVEANGMTELDISGLVKRDGENTLRRVSSGTAPVLNLEWTE
jgi:hypothetical protein